MELTINEVLAGKATKIKDKQYLPTKAYVEPFLERMSAFTDDFRVQAKLPTQITLTSNGKINTEDITFNRVWIEAILPDEYVFEGHRKSVSLLYALDTRKPIVKIFSNTVNMACLNLTVFNKEFLQVQQLEPEFPINFKFVNQVMEMRDQTKEILTDMSNKFLTKDTLFENVGYWVDRCVKVSYDNGFGKVKLNETLPVSVYKDLFVKEDSDYYVGHSDTSLFNVYNAFTNLITNDGGKDIVNKFEKSWLVAKVLGYDNFKL